MCLIRNILVAEIVMTHIGLLERNGIRAIGRRTGQGSSPCLLRDQHYHQESRQTRTVKINVPRFSKGESAKRNMLKGLVKRRNSIRVSGKVPAGLRLQVGRMAVPRTHPCLSLHFLTRELQKTVALSWERCKVYQKI